MKRELLLMVLIVGLLSLRGMGEEAEAPLMKGWKAAAVLDKADLGDNFFKSDFDDSAWKNVDVVAGKAPFREKYIFYRDRVEVPAEWKGKRVILFFDGVDDNATVYVNGEKVGANEGFDVPFDIDVSEALTFGGQNLVAVLCENTGGPGGIWQPVSIRLSQGLREEERKAEEALLGELRGLKHRIIFETNRDGNWELYIMNADGSNPVNLTKTPELDEMYPHCSADGKKVCFVVDEWRDTSRGRKKFRDVCYMNIDGSERTKIAENAREPCWSPNGTKVAFSMGESRDYTTRDYATRGIFIYDLATKQTTQLPNKNIEHLYNTAWSPDGKWFVFTVHKAMGFGHAILAVDSAGERVYPLKVPGCRPDWSPDGKRLSWVLNDNIIAAADFEEGRCVKGAPMPVPLPDTHNVVESKIKSRKTYHPDWSPDGGYLAFSYGSGKEQVGEKGIWDICVVRAAGGPWVALTKNQGANKEPDWAP